jgi:diguanylate cyclase (GGDEF)-like protein
MMMGDGTSRSGCRAIRRHLLFVASLLSAWWLYLPPALAARVLGSDNELPNLSVQAIAQDERGFVWFGTEDGLVRSEGHRFQRIDLTIPGRMTDDYVGDLLAVPGAMYVVMRDAVVRVDTGSLRVDAVRTPKGALDRVNRLELLESGSICGVQSGDALWCWHDREGSARNFVPFLMPGALRDSGAQSLRALGHRLWLASSAGVYAWDETTLKFTQRALATRALQAADVMATSVGEDERGFLWVGFWSHGLLRIDLASGAERWFHPDQAGAGALRATSVYSLETRGDRVYVATNRGLVYYTRECDCLRALSLPEWARADGQGIVIQTVAFEGEGVWAGLWGGGAVRFSALDEVFDLQVPSPERSDALARPMVRALHVTASGSLLVGSTGGGVQSVAAAAREPGLPWTFVSLPWDAPRSESRFIWHIAEHAGGLRIASGDGLFAHDGRTLEEIDPAQRLKSWRSYLQTADGRGYAAGMSGLFAETDGRLQRLALRDADGTEFRAGIWSIAEHQDDLWLATNAGILRVGRDGRLRSRHGVGSGAGELPGETVWAMRRTRDGRLFAGTSGGLVEVHAGSAGVRFERHVLRGIDASRAVVSIAEDDRQLWLGTPSGLIRYQPEAGVAEKFDRRDGLVSDQFTYNGNAYDGERLYFGTVQGLVSFDPRRIRREQTALVPRIGRIRIGEGEWQAASERLSLPRLHAPVQIEISAFEFARPEQLRYAYRWRGENEFVELRGTPTIVAERLDRGVHELEVRVSRDMAGDAAMRTLLRVNVAPAWHERGETRVLLFAALLLCVYVMAGWRSRRDQQQARLLAREVAARTEDLSRTAAALAEANRRLESLAEHDPLTGLLNRRAMFARCEALALSGLPMALMLIDLDRFKQINDDHGHLAGDAVLRDFARVLRDSFDPQGSVLTRFGGEEFVAVLAGAEATRAGAAIAAQRLLAAVRAREVAVGDVRIRYTVSIGLATAESGIDVEIEDLLRRADAAMYRAKSQGRDAVVLD